MKETNEDVIVQHLENQKAFFASNETKDVTFRLKQLRKLKEVVLENQERIQHALWDDLRKSPEETYLTEISIVLSEINNHLKHLKRWAKPKRVPTPLYLRPSSSKTIHEPLGVTLIVAPWNYPFQSAHRSNISRMLYDAKTIARHSHCCKTNGGDDCQNIP